MSLQATKVRAPGSALWIEMDNLCIFAAIIGSLPWVHRSLVAIFTRILPCCIKAVVAVHEQRLRNFREVAVEKGENKNFVPENMATVGLTVQAAGWHSCINGWVVRRSGAHHVEGVQAEQFLAVAVAFNNQISFFPDFIPSVVMRLEERIKRVLALQ